MRLIHVRIWRFVRDQEVGSWDQIFELTASEAQNNLNLLLGYLLEVGATIGYEKHANMIIFILTRTEVGNPSSLIQKSFSCLLVLLTLIPPVQAVEIYRASKILEPIDDFSTRPVWEIIAKKIQGTELSDTANNSSKTEEIRRGIFADYLTYLNSVGVQLASFEESLQLSGSLDFNAGACAEEDEDHENELIRNSLNSDIYTFAKTYCSAPCRKLKTTGFEMIATIEPSGRGSCEETARKIYQDHNCNYQSDIRNLPSNTPPTMGQPESSRFFDSSRTAFKIDMTHSNPSISSDLFKRSSINFSDRSDINVGSNLVTRMNGMNENAKYRSMETTNSWGNSHGASFPVFSTPQNSPPKIDEEIFKEAQKRKTHCEKERDRSFYTTTSEPPFSASKTTSPLVDPKNPGMDPRWTTYAPDSMTEPKGDERFSTEKPDQCRAYSDGYFSKLRSAYMNIAHDAILPILGHWPILDDEGKIKDEYIVAIKRTADPLFFNLISQIETSYVLHCGSRFNTTDNYLLRRARTVITGATVTNPGREVVSDKRSDSKDEEVKDDEPPTKGYEIKTVGHYFSSISKPIESFVDGFLAADRVGAATPVESRADSIATAVRNGDIDEEDIGAAAKTGPYGYRSEAIEKMTRSYLEQNNLSGLLDLAAEIAGGITSGTIVSGGVNLAKNLAKSSSKTANLSKLLLSVRDSIPKPLLRGTQTGAVKILSSAKKMGLHESSDIQRALGSRGKLPNFPDGFTAPATSLDRHGRLTNGKYTISPEAMKPHTVGSFDATTHTGTSLPGDKSQFFFATDADRVTLDAAAYADHAELWVGNKAKVELNIPIGVHGGSGNITDTINVYRNNAGTIHASPASP